MSIVSNLNMMQFQFCSLPHSLVCVRAGHKPRLLVFSCEGSNMCDFILFSSNYDTLSRARFHYCESLFMHEDVQYSMILTL